MFRQPRGVSGLSLSGPSKAGNRPTGAPADPPQPGRDRSRPGGISVRSPGEHDHVVAGGLTIQMRVVVRADRIGQQGKVFRVRHHCRAEVEQGHRVVAEIPGEVHIAARRWVVSMLISIRGVQGHEHQRRSRPPPARQPVAVAAVFGEFRIPLGVQPPRQMQIQRQRHSTPPL